MFPLSAWIKTERLTTEMDMNWITGALSDTSDLLPTLQPCNACDFRS